MRMSDVFGLPVVVGDCGYEVLESGHCNGTECQTNSDAVAIALAVNSHDKLMEIIQMCFEDSCKPSGKLTKKTVLEVMKFADTRA